MSSLDRASVCLCKVANASAGMHVYMYAISIPCALRSRPGHSPIDTVRMPETAITSACLVEERLKSASEFLRPIQCLLRDELQVWCDTVVSN